MALRRDLFLSCCSHGDTNSFQTNTLLTPFTPACRLLTLTPLSSSLLTFLRSCGLTGNDSGGCYSCRLASHLHTSPNSLPTFSSLVLRALSRPRGCTTPRTSVDVLLSSPLSESLSALEAGLSILLSLSASPTLPTLLPLSLTSLRPVLSLLSPLRLLLDSCLY